MDNSSEDSFEKKKAEAYDTKDKMSDDQLSDYISEDSEDEAERIRKQEEEELKQHRIAMAKREGKIQAKKEKAANLRSSKGFLTQKEDESEQMRASFQKEKKDDDEEICPYGKCGRKFTSEDQLKSHIERRHKNEQKPPQEEKKSAPPIKKAIESFDTVKKQSTKLGSLKKIPENNIVSQSIMSFTDNFETPVPEKSKIPSALPPKAQPKEMHSFEAKPKARPITSWGAGGRGGVQQPTSTDQQQILQDIMKSSAKAQIRPQTAATTTLKDETRIMNKLRVLEKIEQRIEEDLEEFLGRRGDQIKSQKKGVQITRPMILEASQSDTLFQVSTVILRDKNIEIFEEDQPASKNYFSFDELVNLECIFASHNLIKDIYGICRINTLRELNLSFNMIQDITPIDQLCHLEKLFLNRNKIAVLDPIKKLTSLQVLELFHNEIFNASKALEIFAFLGINYKLRELSVDGNPITSTTKFKNQLLVSIPKLEMLDEERIQSLDREVANQYFELNKIQKPCFFKDPVQAMAEKQGQSFDDFLKEGASVDAYGNPIASAMKKKVAPGEKKQVKFAGQIDDDHEGNWQNQEIKKLQKAVTDLGMENSDLRKKLEKKNYDQVYKENTRLNMELKSMYIVMEENKDLKEDLDRLKNISYDQKVKNINQENADLRQRNGYLLIQNDNLKQKCKETDDNIKKIQQGLLPSSSDKPKLERPQTAAVFGRKKEDMIFQEGDLEELAANAQSQFDIELNELLAKNQERLNELHSDMRDVSKISGEPTVQIRKLKNADNKRVLKQSLQENQNSENQIDSSTQGHGQGKHLLKPIVQKSEDIEYI